MARVLGARVDAPSVYSPDILEPIYREQGRKDFSANASNFYGFDCWHLYELSWLDPGGRSQHFVGVLTIDCASHATVESKSLKLYLNSLNFHVFSDAESAKNTIIKDLSAVIGGRLTLDLLPPDGLSAITHEASGALLEATEDGKLQGSERFAGETIEETLISHRLRSLCPVTAQPDWGTLVLTYVGQPIRRDELSEYVDSFRQRQDFHEQCLEGIFHHVMQSYSPDRLTATAFYQRRGGIDITPTRASFVIPDNPVRIGRQ